MFAQLFCHSCSRKQNAYSRSDRRDETRPRMSGQPDDVPMADTPRRRESCRRRKSKAEIHGECPAVVQCQSTIAPSPFEKTHLVACFFPQRSPQPSDIFRKGPPPLRRQRNLCLDIETRTGCESRCQRKEREGRWGIKVSLKEVGSPESKRDGTLVRVPVPEWSPERMA